ncbi:ATP-binding protein [Ignavibacteriales bacterium]
MSMIKREIEQKLIAISGKFPVIAILGPRQSGKTTLAKNLFSDYIYVNLEEPDTRLFAMDDPRSFLQNPKMIIDEIQRVPELLSYIQSIVDKEKEAGQFIITGSQNFLINEKISQSLAGRVAILNLLPFTLEELFSAGEYNTFDRFEAIYKGFYPPLHDRQIDPNDWFPNYISTYVERDVRLIKNIGDLGTFLLFLKLLAGRIGQLLNLSSLASETGISVNTAKSWISILEASFVIFTMQPWFSNINKRLVKQSKIFFYDTGLAVALLEIRRLDHLKTYFQVGSLFENMIIVDLLKRRFNNGLPNNLFFLRDKAGREIDCVLDNGTSKTMIEIKAGQTINRDFFSNLTYFSEVDPNPNDRKYLVYGGEENQERLGTTVLSWKNLNSIS